jgi:hypothetical protein
MEELKKTQLVKTAFWIGFTATVTLLGLLYYPTLGYYFIHEDADFVCAINQPGAIYYPQEWGFRLLGDLMRWDFFLSGKNPLGYHIYNLSVHLIVCWFLYLLCRRLNIGKILSLVGVLIFSIHPAVFGVVGWIAGRLDIDVTAWILATILCYDKYLNAEKPQRCWWFAAAILLYLAGLLSKETAYIVPLLLIPWEYSLYGKVKWKRALRNSGIFLGMLLALLGFRLLIGASMGVYGGMHGRVGLFQLENLWRYLTIIFVNDLTGIISVVISIIGVVLLLLVTVTNKRALFPLLLLLLPIIVVSNLTLESWYLYLPIAAFAILLMLALNRLSSLLMPARTLKWSLAGIASLVLVGGYVVIHLPQTFRVNQMYSTGGKFMAGLMRQFELEENRPPPTPSLIIIDGMTENVGGYMVYPDEIAFDLDLVVNGNYTHGRKHLTSTEQTIVFYRREWDDYRHLVDGFKMPLLIYRYTDGRISRDRIAEVQFMREEMLRQPGIYANANLFAAMPALEGIGGLEIKTGQGLLEIQGSGLWTVSELLPNKTYAFYLKIRSDAPALFISPDSELSIPGDDSFSSRLFLASSDDSGTIVISVINKGRIQIDEMIYGIKPDIFPQL